MARKVTASDAYRFIRANLAKSAASWFEQLKRNRQLNDANRTGFYIGAYDITNPVQPTLICMHLIGIVDDDEKRGRYQRLVSRKCVDQLGANRAHISSAQSQDPSNEYYPGAVRNNPLFWNGLDIAVGVSGLHSLDDETIAAQVAVMHRMLNHTQDLFDIACASNNRMLKSLI